MEYSKKPEMEYSKKWRTLGNGVLPEMEHSLQELTETRQKPNDRLHGRQPGPYPLEQSFDFEHSLSSNPTRHQNSPPEQIPSDSKAPLWGTVP